MTYEVAVIGDPGSVMAFRGLGFQVVALDDFNGAERELYRLIDSERYAIIYITEPLARQCEHVLAKMRGQALPAIIPIPAANDSGGYASQNLRESVIKAIGFDVLANNKEDGDREA